jgi:sugar lactone lactonase YvrE
VALAVLLVPSLVWASFTILNYPFVNVVSTGGVTLSGPTSVAVDGQGNIYIADSGHNQVVEVTAAGVASVVSFPGLSPSLASATAVAVDGSGNLYVADSINSRVVKLAAGLLRWWPRPAC